MTIASEICRKDYTAVGGLDTYPFTFEIYTKNDIKVYVDGILKTVDVNYSIPVGDINNPAGGNVVFIDIPTAGQAIAIILDLPLTQLINYVEGDKFPAETHEKGLDRLVKIVQSFSNVLGRVLKVPSWSTLTNIFVEVGAGEYLRWNATGTKIITDSGTIIGGDIDHTQYIKHSLATAEDDFLIASGVGVFVKKTLAETQAIIGGSGLNADTVDTQHRVLTINVDHTHQTTGAMGGKLDHGLALTGLTDDDHNIYSLINGTRAFTGVVSGVNPTQLSHLATKGYVDTMAEGIGFDPVLDRYDPTGGLPGAPTTGDRYLSTATANGWTIDYLYEYNGATWDEQIPSAGDTVLVIDEATMYAYTGTAWISLSATDHGSLSGLLDDDHTQYYNATRHTKAVHDALNVNADTLDTYHATSFLPAGVSVGQIQYLGALGLLDADPDLSWDAALEQLSAKKLYVASTASIAGWLTLGGVNAGRIILYEDDMIPVYTTSIKTQLQSANIALQLPAAQGAANTYLKNDGSGVLSWDAAGGVSQTPWTSNIDAAGYTLYGNSTSGGNLTLSSTSHATKGTINIGSAGEKVKTIASVFPSSGSGGFANLAFGTSGVPLVPGDFPIVIDHHITGAAHYAIYLKTTADTLDGGSGLVVENFGASDGATFAIATANANVGACALGVPINNTSDVHDQYGISMLHRHGRSIIIQSQGTGESIEIRRNANASGTLKSGAHIYIDENVGNYGHLIGLKMVGYSAASDADVMIDVRKGAASKFAVNQSGAVYCTALVVAGQEGFAKATGGTLSFAALADADIPDTITLTNITQITNRSHTSLSDIGTLTHATIDGRLGQAVNTTSTPTFGQINTTADLVLRSATANAGTIYFGSDLNDYLDFNGSNFNFGVAGAVKARLDTSGNWVLYGALYTGGASPLQVVGARVIDARCDDVVDNTYGAEEAGVLDALRDAMISHGLIAAA